MKSILLISALFCFNFAYCQDNECYNGQKLIQDHIKKKNETDIINKAVNLALSDGTGFRFGCCLTCPKNGLSLLEYIQADNRRIATTYGGHNVFFDQQKYIKRKNELAREFTVDELFIRGNRCWEPTNLLFSKKGIALLRARTEAKILTGLVSRK